MARDDKQILEIPKRIFCRAFRTVAASWRFAYAQPMKTPHRAALCFAWSVFWMLSFLSASASAHHATATEYDVSKSVLLKGTIARVDWANPHIHVYIEVRTEQGATQEWDVEFPSPGAAVVAGLSKQILSRGTVLTFEGFPSKPDFHPRPRGNGNANERPGLVQRFACATAVTLSDGTHVTFVVGI